MKKDKSIILLLILGAIVFIYFAFFYVKIDFELTNEIVSVNLYDTVNLKEYIVKAKDNNGKNLINKVKISADRGDNDTLKKGELFIGDISGKTVTYTLKYKFKTVKRTLEVVVITDPNDPAFKANTNPNAEKNEHDVPDSKVNKNLTESQKKYVKSIVK